MVFIGSGLLAGFVGGLFGIGGGVILVPLFIYLFGHFGVSHTIVMHLAVGTSLSLVIPTALAASWEQFHLGKLDLRYYRSWAISVFVGVIGGLCILPFITTKWLESIFVAFLLLIAIDVGFVKKSWVITKRPPTGWRKWLTAGVIGLFSSLLGLGGGVLTTPTMRTCNYPMKKAIALASATGLVVGVVGAIGAIIVGFGVPGRPAWAFGYVDMIAFLTMLPSVLLAAPLGAFAENRLPRVFLKALYALFLVSMAIYMLRDMLTH